MPIYEYRCASCGFQKEYLQKLSDPLLSVCPECSRETFDKMLTAAGFQLKGGGWYATDFKHSGAKPADKKEGKDGKEGKSATDAKTETSAAGKNESKAATPPAPAATPAPAPSAAKAE